MIQLRTLGAVDLRAAGGSEIRAVLQQPKRLALLVYLVTAKAGRLHRRDTLLALFWPDLDQDHARAALRRALYFLRQACGPDLISGRGDEEVGIDSGRVDCDALRFDDAIDRDDLPAALELYQGGFLDGFYVQGAAEAEAWFDRERTRRRYDAATASWQLARAALDEPATAARWAARAIGLAPSDEDAIVSFIGELERRDERSLALRLYDQAVERIRTDLAAEPRADLAAAAGRLRAAGATAGPTAAVVDSPNRSLVAVCPFRIVGDPALGYLSEGMVDLFSTKLDGTGALRSADARRVLQLSGADAVSGVDLAAALELGRQLGAGLVVIGTIVANGGELEASVVMHDTAGAVRGRAAGRSSAEHGLFDLVDELVRRLVSELDQTAGGRLARLAALTTESLPALKAYLAGEHEFRLGRLLPALDLFRRATVEDRSFALAYYRLASSLAANALIGPARQASAEAFRHRERLTDHDRLLLEAQHAWLGGRTWEAERRYAALTVSFPEQLEAWYHLGDLLFHANPYRGRSIAEAREPFARALAIDPTHVGARTQLARIAALEGDRPALEEHVERALTTSPGADQALGLRVLMAFTGTDAAARAAVTDELTRASGLVIARAFTDVALYARDLPAAGRLAEALLPAARSPDFAALGRIVLAHLEMALGRPAAALEHLAAAAAGDRAWALEVKGLFAALPWQPFDQSTRTAIEAELEAWDASTVPASVAVPLVFHDGLHQHFRRYLLGLLAARRGDAPAVRLAAEALSELPVPTGAEVLGEQLARTLDAEAFRLEGKPALALQAMERLTTDVWFQYAVGSPFFAGTYQRWFRAELLEELGRPGEAAGWRATMAQRSPYELVFATDAAMRRDRAGRPPHS